MTYSLNPDMRSQDYHASELLDVARARLGVKSDAKLAAHLGVTAPIISKIRHKLIALGPSMMIRIHEAIGMPMVEIRGYLGVKLA